MSELPKVAIVGGPDVDARIELMQHLKSNFETVAVGTNKALSEKFKSEGFEYQVYNLGRGVNPIQDLIAFGQLIYIFRKIKPLIVHTFDTKPGVWARLAARLAGVPVVIGTLPGLGSLYGADSLFRRIIRSIYQLLQFLASKYSDLTIFQNEDDVRQFIEAGIVDENKTKVVLGSGISTKIFDKTRFSDRKNNDLKIEFGIKKSEIVVTMVSRIIRSKGVFEFVEAAKMVRSQNQNVRFLLIGSEDLDSLDQLNSQELVMLKESVIWPGSRQDIPSILAASDIFILPTALREGIPRVLLEAAAVGLPIITTDTPGCKEVVENGVNGFLVSLRDPAAFSQAVIRLVEDQKLRISFGKKSRQRAVEKFDISVISNETQLVYQHLLAAHDVITSVGLGEETNQA